MTDTSGLRSHDASAFWDPDSLCWRTSQTTLFGDSPKYSETFPTSGMTRGGRLYRLPTPGPATNGGGCSLLPTPRTTDSNGAGAHGSGGMDLRTTVTELLPTPTATDTSKHAGQAPEKRRGRGHSTRLADAAMELLPTPRATDGTKGGPNQRGSRGDLMLPSAVMELLPMPTAMDAKASRNATSSRKPASAHHDGMTLTDAIWSIGDDGELQWNDGAESSDAPPLFRST